MTYLQALRLMVKAYKAAKGTMPKGLDLLKMKMKARQKAIDSTKGKVIQFPPERITDPFKARPQPPKIKIIKGIQTTRGLGDLFKRQMEKIGQKAKQESKPKSKKLEDAMESFFGFKPKRETEAQMLARMKRENKEAAQRLRDKKKPRDDKAGGGITDAIKKIKRRFGKKSITTGDKIKRPGNRQLFDDFKKRNKFNVGGMANLSETYDNNPTLQAQFPNKQDYLDLFGGIASTTAAQTTTPMMTQQATQSPVIKPIKPIIPQGDDGDGGGTTIGTGRTFSRQPNYMGGKQPGIVAALQRTVGDLTTAGKEIYNFLSPIQFAKRTAKRMDAGLKAAQDYLEEKRKEKERERRRQYEAQIQNAINQGRQMQQAYEDSYASMGYSSPAERAADTPTGTLGRV